MKYILTFAFAVAIFSCSAQQKIVGSALSLGIGGSYAGEIRAIASDSTEAPFAPGTVYYESSSRTVVKVLQNLSDEKKFELRPVKSGKSTITIQCTRLDGKVLTKTFVVTVAVDAGRQAGGFIINLLPSKIP